MASIVERGSGGASRTEIGRAWRVGGLAALGLACLIATWAWVATSENRALRALPDEERQGLYQRSLEDVRRLCDGRDVPAIFCRRQAEVLEVLPECQASAQCQTLIAPWLPTPRR